MKEILFTCSTVDECILYIGQTMYAALYIEYLILAVPDQEEIDQIIEDLNRSKFILAVEGYLQELLGVNIEIHGDVTINLTQPHLIYQIVA